MLRVRRHASGTGFTAANVLGVLSRVDQVANSTGDPWPISARIAARYARGPAWRHRRSAPSVRLARHARTATERCQRLYFAHREEGAGS